MVEIDFGKRLAYPLALFPDGAIGRSLGEWRQPIEHSETRQREQIIGPVEQFGAETAEHGAAFNGQHYTTIMLLRSHLRGAGKIGRLTCRSGATTANRSRRPASHAGLVGAQQRG